MRDIVNKLLYVGYFIKNCDYRVTKNNVNNVSQIHDVAKLSVLLDMLICSVRYESSFDDYFDLRFFELGKAQRLTYATTGKIYSFQSENNNKSFIKFFRDKGLFAQYFESYLGRSVIAVNGSSSEDLDRWLKRHPIFIAKPIGGQVGQGIEKLDVSKLGGVSPAVAYLHDHKLDLLEEVIVQHRVLTELIAQSVNTVRLISHLREDDVEFLGASLRIGVGGVIDGRAAGGIAAPLDLKTGIVNGPAVSTAVEYREHASHPITGAKIHGLVIPYWDRVKQIVDESARIIPEVRTVGWDIAITESGPVIVEGNDNWDKVLWQMPHRMGFLHLIESD